MEENEINFGEIAEEEKTCEFCGQVLKANEETTTAFFRKTGVSGLVGGEVCKECIEKSFDLCSDCDNYYEKEVLHDIDGDLVCETCLEESGDYYRCDECGEYHHINNMTEVNGDGSGEFVCDDCLSRYYEKCDNCGEYVKTDYMYTDINGNYICEYCRDNYYITCENCGELIHEDNAYYDDETDRYYCEDCYYDLEREGESNMILSYHGNNGVWHPYKTDSDGENPTYMGFELEIEHKEDSTKNQEEAIEIIKDNINCYLEHDGSLNYGGFEIVSEPQTYNYIMEQYEKYDTAFKKLVDLGYISHNRGHCGLHFHITAPDREIREDIVSRLWLIVETYKEQFEKLSRREDYYFCNFLSKNNENGKLNNIYKLKQIDKTGQRYLVINNRNEKTIEIRIFRGTLKAETFFADLQFVHNLFTLAYDLSIPIEDIDWAKLIEGEYINAYCTENNIFTDKRIVDDSMKYITLENKAKKVINQMLNEYTKEVMKYGKQVTKIKDINAEELSQSRRIYNNFANLTECILNIKDCKNISRAIFRLREFIDWCKTYNVELTFDKEKLQAKYDKLQEYNEELQNM